MAKFKKKKLAEACDGWQNVVCNQLCNENLPKNPEDWARLFETQAEKAIEENNKLLPAAFARILKEETEALAKMFPNNKQNPEIMKETTTIFVVSSKFCGDFFIEAAFSTKQQAEDFITQREMSSGYITELTIDKPNECTEDIPFRPTPRQDERVNQAFNLIKDKNAVMHIAKMQQQIDTFKAALLHINERINNGNKCNLVYTEPLDENDKHFINNIIRFIDQHAHAPEKNRTLEDIVAPAFKNDKAALEDYCSKMNDAAKKLGIDPLDCSVEDAIKICDEFDKMKAENQTTVFDIYPQIKQSNALNIVAKSLLDDFTTDPEAELNEDDLDDIAKILSKNGKHGYVTASPTNKDSFFRRTFIAPNLNEKGFLRQDRFATELTTENGVKYMLFFPWSKLNNLNAPYNEK